MRRIVQAVLILILPTILAVVIYLIAGKPQPTNRAALGRVSTIAGTGAPGIDDGAALSSTFSDPFGLAVDRRGNLLVADAGQSNRIRRVTTKGRVETIAGSSEGFADGKALQAQFNTPSGIAIDRAGNIFIADTSNNRIRKLSADGTIVSTIAGTGAAGLADGRAQEAQFDGPIGIAVDKSGNLFVADAYNDCIRKITKDGVVTMVAGTGLPGYRDGAAQEAMFDTPSGIALDDQGNIVVADTGNHAVRKINLLGEVTTIAGRSAEHSRAGDVSLNHPVGVSVTHDGFIFVSDAERGRIVRISPEGESQNYAGSGGGFVDSTGGSARFNGPTSLVVDRQGVIYVADTQNFLIREIVPVLNPPPSKEPGVFIQPPGDNQLNSPTALPALSPSIMGIGQTFPWPLSPQGGWHEVTGVVGEARGAPGGVALDHLHAGLDIRGARGDGVYSVMDEKVSKPISNWGFQEGGEGISVGLMSYIHLYVGRTAVLPGRETTLATSDKFKPRPNQQGVLEGVRVRRGTRFRVGDFIGSLNWLNHVHLNLGPWNAQANPLMLPFIALRDSIGPTIESIEVVAVDAVARSEPPKTSSKASGAKAVKIERLVISGDVAIVVTAYDRADGNSDSRKLGLFRVGYQLLHPDGSPVKGFEHPLMNIEFDRLPPDDSSVFKIYAPGSGISAYGTPTRFRYIVTNRVRGGEAMDGFLRTQLLESGDYLIRIIAEDFEGNRSSGPSNELAVTIKN